MTITAKVLADSISEQGHRLTTLQLRYPKFIHGEAKTHRQLLINDEWVDVMGEVGFMDDRNLSRNASSSRAIPVERLIRDVVDDPAIPMHWGKNQPGMQAREQHDAMVMLDERMAELNGSWELTNLEAWLAARDVAVAMAKAFAAAGYHKQIVNRLLEPFCHINVVVSATEWYNFFALRDHPDAQPEIEALAKAMREAMAASDPLHLRPGEWHLPYLPEYHGLRMDVGDTLIKVSTARCARVSYLTQDGRRTTTKEDVALYERLVVVNPLHASPAEHQATPDALEIDGWAQPTRHGNLVGWVQHRKLLSGECQ